MIRHVFWRASALALLLVAAPLPFGGVLPLASTLLFLGALLAFAMAVARRAESADPLPPRPTQELRAFRLAAGAIAALALIGFLQSLPWPPALVRVAAPQIATLAAQATEIAAIGAPRGAEEADPNAGVALSLAPGASRSAAFDWLLVVVAALAAAAAGVSRRVRRVLAGALLTSAAIQIVIGVQLWISRSSTVWGIEVPRTINRLRGSFVNPNHLALFLEIALVVSFAWLWFVVRRSWMEEDRAENRLLRIAPAALVFFLLFAGVVLTGSRAGILASLAALAVQGLLAGGSRRRNRLAGLVAAGAGTIFVFLLRVEGSFGRISETSLGGVTENTRLQAALATLDLWQLSPITGVGLGAFRAAFPLVQPENLPGLWRHAHSDWVELLATAGVVGMALFLFALFCYLRRLAVVLRHGERSEDRAAGIAAAGALVVVGLHSFVDFGLTMPANAFALAVVLGAAAAARTRVGIGASTAAD